jgi:hypothetical protein
MADPSPLPAFQMYVEHQEQRIDALISPPGGGHRSGWSKDLADPEFHKNIRIFGRLVVFAGGLVERLERCRLGSAEPVPRLPELQRRVTLPEPALLTLPLLLQHRFSLELLLVELGDATYLRTRSAELYKEEPGTIVTWRQMYRDQPPPLFADDGQARDDAIELTRSMLGQLLAAKEAQDLPVRARRELKRRVLLTTVLPSVMVVAALFGLALAGTDASAWRTLALPVAASVTGAVLGRLLHLRDEVSRGAQVREFLPLFFAQAVVGLVTGLFVFVAVDQLAIVNAGDPKRVATLAFVAGFSEAAFLGLVTKITGESRKPPDRSDRS